MTCISLLFLPQSVFADDTPRIPPARLDFKAERVPSKCKDRRTFDYIIRDWLPAAQWQDDADRTLTVRIHPGPNGARVSDVTLVDAVGAILAEEHETFGMTTECHKVLYDTARSAARLMGAFNPPPPPEPCPTTSPCPECPPCSLPHTEAPVPVCPACRNDALPEKLAPDPMHWRRSFFGAGVGGGNGMSPALVAGPRVFGGFSPFRQVRRFELEWSVAWLSGGQTAPNDHAVPMTVSACYWPYVFRVCSGFASTVMQANAGGDERSSMSMAGSLRFGVEARVAGPLSLRGEIEMLWTVWQRSFGDAGPSGQHVVSGAPSLAAVWSLE